MPVDNASAVGTVFDIKQLQERAYRIVGTPEPIQFKDKVIGLVMYRDNTVIDVVREIGEYDYNA